MAGDRTDAQRARNAAYMRAWQAQHKHDPNVRGYVRRSIAQYKAQYPEKNRAHRAVRQAIASGVLVRPGHCARCGTACKPEASHDDYDRQLDVEWLCRPCHRRKDLLGER